MTICWKCAGASFIAALGVLLLASYVFKAKPVWAILLSFLTLALLVPMKDLKGGVENYYQDTY